MIRDPEKNSIEVSVIIVNYNADKLLRECLSSLIKYTNNISYEIIVVDNCSTQGSVDRVISEFDNVILIKADQNLGYAEANNQGAQVARGEYLLILNNDVVFIENSIEEILNFAKGRDDNVFIGCKLLNEDKTFQESVVDFPTLQNTLMESFFLYKMFPRSKFFNKYSQNYMDAKNPIEVDFVKGAFIFCETIDYKALNGFDERFYFYGEETDLCYRFKNEKNGKVLYYPNTAIIHIGGATTQKDLWFKYKNQTFAKIQFFQKHYHGIRFVTALILHLLGVLLRAPLYFCGGLITFNKNLLIKSYYFTKQLFTYPKNKFKIVES